MDNQDFNRIARLRERVTSTPSPRRVGRDALFRESYIGTVGEPAVLREAKAIAHYLRKRTVFIQDDELLIGVDAPTDVPMPEIDPNLLPPPQHYRPPTWPEAQQAALDGGIFALAGNHTTIDYETILNIGFWGIHRRVKERVSRLTVGAPEYERKRDFLTALDIVSQAIIHFSGRYSAHAASLADREADPRRRSELLTLSEICRQVPANPARTFYEAVQSIWFSFFLVPDSPGRVDQYLYPYYERDIANGILTEEFALELIKCLWLKYCEVTGPQDGVSARHHVALGGVKADGTDASHPVTYLCLQATEELKLIRPQVSLRWHHGTPSEVLCRAVQTLRSRTGQPSFTNDETIVPGLCKVGASLEDARDYSLSGCNEVILTGKSHMGSVEGFINMPKLLEVAMGIEKPYGNGADDAPVNLERIDSYKMLWERLVKQMANVAHFVADVSEGLDALRAQWPGGGLLQSLMTADCIENCRGWTEGGARYNACNWNAVGITNLADSLMAIKELVFERHILSLAQFAEFLQNDWAEHESFRRRILRDVPHFGNDVDNVDSVATEIVSEFASILRKRTPYRGGQYTLGTLGGAENMHVVFGKKTGATPDGRKSGDPFADTIGASQGRDRNGPTSLLNSVAKIDHTLMPTSVTLNLKMDPRVIASDTGVQKVAAMIDSHFASGGQQLQFNILDKAILLAAKRNPEQYPDVLVRVCGYSAPFISLWSDLQDEIIARTEHEI